MADTEILKRAEKYIKGKGQTLNKYDLVGFANAETELLSKHILELQADKGELTDKVKELAAQIEKMKLCANCKHCGVSGWCDKLNRYLLDKVNQRCGNWEIKENG